MSELDQLLRGELPKGPFQFTLNDAQLTDFANSYAREQPELGMSDTMVHVFEGGIDATAKAKMGALPLGIKFSALVSVQEGKIAFEITNLEINRMPAPSFLRDQIVKGMNERLDPADWPVTIEKLELHDGELTVAGVVK